jgi:hypothetical protein|nr:MAG TPA: hypothetical protein [Caudoviricetes sp.]
MTRNGVLTDLIGNLIYARSGWGDWVKRAKAVGLPGWPLTLETAGALARLPSYKETVPLSESEVKARMRSLLKRRGDCGWSGLIELMLGRARSGLYWLIEKRNQWPAAMATWPEERVRTMTFALCMDEQLLLPDAVALFETVETCKELTLAHWLTGRTWAKGARVVEVMETAQLSLAESPRYTSQLWRQLRKDQSTWLTKSLIRVIDGEHQRDLWKWFNSLDWMRATHAPRT